MKKNIRLFLSRFPKFTFLLKKIIVFSGAFTGFLNAKVFPDNFSIVTSDFNEAFMGYFGGEPESMNFCLITAKRSQRETFSLYCTNFDGDCYEITSSPAWSYQQGCRSIWINDYQFVYNDRTSSVVSSKKYCMKTKKSYKISDLPVMDAKNDLVFLGNYNSYKALAAEYYIGDSIISNNDIIFELRNTIQNTLVWAPAYSNFKDHFSGFDGVVIHPLISPTGNRLQIIYRGLINGRRVDRLLICDVAKREISKPFPDGIFSHFCWIDDETMVGYFQIGKRIGYWKLNVETGFAEPINFDAIENVGDGHPVVRNSKLYVDTYPSLSRVQSLFEIDMKTGSTINSYKFFSPPKFSFEKRCDLHPRVSRNGKIFVDVIVNNKRHVAISDEG